MTQVDNKAQEDKLSREDHILNYIKALDQIEQAIEPFREHKIALKQHYVENDWLSRADQSLILKAYRMLKNKEDLEEVRSYYDLLEKNKVGN